MSSHENGESVKNNSFNQREDDLSKESKREKYLIFSLLKETYGIPLSSVKEVIGLTDITSIPNVPDYFKGLINLRGKIISVIDLRKKLSLPEAEYEEKKTCIIIVEFDDFVLGTIVDDVSAVEGFMLSQLEHGLDINSKVSRDYIVGVAKNSNKKLTLLLDIAKVLNVDELKMIRNKVAA